MQFEDRYRGKSGTGVRAALAVIGLTLTAPAFAYIDPGTGSIILQSLLAGIAVAVGVLRAYWHRVRSFFSRSESAHGRAEPDADQKAEAGSGR